MNKAKMAWACAALAWAPWAGAQQQAMDRAFPPQARYCESTDNALPQRLSATMRGVGEVALSPALVIRDQSNRVVVNSALPRQWAGMCSAGLGGALEKIWLLTPEQAERARQRRAQQAAGEAR